MSNTELDQELIRSSFVGSIYAWLDAGMDEDELRKDFFIAVAVWKSGKKERDE